MNPLVFMFPALKDPPTTGGERYNLELTQRLPKAFALETVTFADLGISLADGPKGFERAVLAWADRRREPGAILQDTYCFELATETNRALRRRGYGPLIGFAQAVYPERYRAPWAKARRFWRLRQLWETRDWSARTERSWERPWWSCIATGP